MRGKIELLFVPFIVLGLACTACASKEVIDPTVAQQDPDFGIQGEYLGEGSIGQTQGPIGAQVIARGKGAFDVVVYQGGLPGAGWRRGDVQLQLQAKLKGDVVTLSGKDLSGKIAQGTLSLEGTGDQAATTMELKRIDRKSPTLGLKAPEGATVLFDGTSAEAFVPSKGHLTDLNTLLSGVTTKDKFGSYTLHLEFRLSWMPQARGQARSNSGVYLHDAYEVQVLDSFGLEGKDNECGGIYKVQQPAVNMCLPPLAWQTYDMEFTAPRYEDGKKVRNARLTARHNGVVIHDDLELPHGTPGRQPEGPAPRPLYLQGHGNKVQYQNVWLEQK